MKRSILFLIPVFISLYPSILYADGQYSIETDQNGMYMKTQQDGSWYIDREDVTGFTVGDNGTYSVGEDSHGYYILVGKNRKFYIDKTAQDRLQTEVEEYNKKYALEHKMETKVIVEENQVLVPVVLGHKGKEIEVLLILDSGASTIVLHKEVAEQLKMESIQKGELRVVGGSSIAADFMILDSVKAGPITKKNIAAGVIEYNGPPTRHKGLLGMNFLENLVYRIDFKRQQIVWER